MSIKRLLKAHQPSWVIQCQSHPCRTGWPTVVEGAPKAPFSIATTLKGRGGRYFFPWITPLIMLNVKQGGIKYYFLGHWYDSTWD